MSVKAERIGDTKRWLSTGAAAAMTGMSSQTIRRWIDRGLLPASRPFSGGANRIDASALAAVMQKRG